MSGRPLKERSLDLVERASRYLRDHPPGHELHVVRTGGIENAGDVRASLDAGAALCQWYSGLLPAVDESEPFAADDAASPAVLVVGYHRPPAAHAADLARALSPPEP